MFVSFGLWESPKIAKLNRVHLLWVVRSFVVGMARSDLRFHFMGAQITIGGIGIGCPADLGVKSKAHFKWTTGHATSINFWFVRWLTEFYHSLWFIFPLILPILNIGIYINTLFYTFFFLWPTMYHWRYFYSTQPGSRPNFILKTISSPSWTPRSLVFSESGAC